MKESMKNCLYFAFLIAISLTSAFAQPVVGGRIVAMGAHAAALSIDPSAIYYNPATAASDGQMQIEAFATDSTAMWPTTWGVAVRKPGETGSSAVGLMFLRRKITVDTSEVRSSQAIFALTDKKFGLPIGAGAKLIWEQNGKGHGWVYGFSLDVGFLLPLGNFRIGGAARNLCGMRTITEPRKFEAGVALQLTDLLVTAGSSTQDLVGKHMISQGKKTWGYGLNYQLLDNTAVRIGRFMEQGHIGETAGAAYSTESTGLVLGYSIRRFSDDPSNVSHWISYTYTANNE